MLKQATMSAISFSLSVVFGWAAISPIDYVDSTSVTAGARLFDWIARKPDPYLRLTVDLFFVLLFAAGGVIMLIRFAPSPSAR